jgi:DMSO/TMAO reductase YedYZ heme-binding membrane subunit
LACIENKVLSWTGERIRRSATLYTVAAAALLIFRTAKPLQEQEEKRVTVENTD